MARSVTRQYIREQAKLRADMENSNFISDDEANAYIDASATELYDLLVGVYSDYYVSQATVSVVAGTDHYSLPTDFYKLLGVDLVIDTQGNAVTLKPFVFAERNSYIFTPTWNVVGLAYLRYHLRGSEIHLVPRPNTNQSLRLWYVPAMPALTSDSSTLDGINGWEEYVITDVAIKMAQKEESDVSVLMAQKAALIQRINSSAINRDAGAPDKVSDVTKQLPYEFWSFGSGS